MRELKDVEARGQKLITNVDRAALAAMCQHYGDMVRAATMIRDHGDVYPIKDDKGGVKYLQQSPWVSMFNKASNGYLRYAAEFGLTPSARARLDVAKTGMDRDDDNPFAKRSDRTG